MRVAAMVIIIAGAGLIGYNIFKGDESPADSAPIAQVDEQNLPVTPDTTPVTGQAAAPVTPPDTTTITFNAARPKDKPLHEYKGNTVQPAPATELARVDPPPANQGDVKTLGNKWKEDKPAKDVTIRPDTKTEVAKIEPRQEDKVSTIPAEKDESASKAYSAYRNKSLTAGNRANASNEFRGTVLSPTNQPLANANIQLDNSRKTIVTDDQGNFSLNAKDSVVLATVASSGYMDTRVALRSNTQNTINIGNIVLQPDPGFDNIAVTGLGTSKKNRLADTLTAKPEGGWESFQQYVASKLDTRPDTTGRDMRLNGELELEFLVDANGNPMNVKVINSTNPALNQKAIEAVRQGPKWATRKKKTRILIRF